MAIRPTRAESFTANKKQTEFFSDFLNSFAKTPVGDKLARVTNENSVNQSIRNIVKTVTGERPFNRYFGSDIFSSLFDPNDIIQLEQIKRSILVSIQNFEPRAIVNDINVRSSININLSVGEIPITNDNQIEVTILYSLINSTEQTSLTFLLKRVR